MVKEPGLERNNYFISISRKKYSLKKDRCQYSHERVPNQLSAIVTNGAGLSLGLFAPNIIMSTAMKLEVPGLIFV